MDRYIYFMMPLKNWAYNKDDNGCCYPMFLITTGMPASCHDWLRTLVIFFKSPCTTGNKLISLLK